MAAPVDPASLRRKCAGCAAKLRFSFYKLQLLTPGSDELAYNDPVFLGNFLNRAICFGDTGVPLRMIRGIHFFKGIHERGW